MAYLIKDVTICAGVLLLFAAHNLGNPLSRDPRSAAASCSEFQLDTNSENDSLTQVTNGITVFMRLVAQQLTRPIGERVSTKHKSYMCQLVLVLFNMTRLSIIYSNAQVRMFMKYQLGLEAVCTAYNSYLRYTIALNNTLSDESDEEFITLISSQYVAQRVMESACRWVYK